MRRGAKPAKAKVEAKLPAARKSGKNDNSRVQDLEKRLAEALKREAATSEILRVISNSPRDIQPVLDAVAENAARLCAAYDAVIDRLDGDVLRLVAHYGPIPARPPALALSVVRSSLAGRTVLDRQAIQVADLQAETEEFLEGSELARKYGFRTVLSVPLLREGVAIGTIALRRTEVQPFTDTQIALLLTFADQAVIAIENVRLFTELQENNRALTQAHAQMTETLEQQTATAEILRVISQSPTNVQPVLDTIAESALRLFRAWTVAVYRFDGELVHAGAYRGGLPDSEQYVRQHYPMRLTTGGSIATRSIQERAIQHLPDCELDPDPLIREVGRSRGFRAVVSVPMLRDGEPVGAINVTRAEAGSFPPAEIALLLTFADQAVIAIENVRLFTELEQRNRQLTEALEHQTATSEILGVISSSPTDSQPVFDTILERALNLCGATLGLLVLYDGETYRPVAERGATPEFREFLFRPPRRPDADTALGQAMLCGEPVQVADVTEEPAYRAGNPIRLAIVQAGARTLLAIPMLKDRRVVGAIAIYRSYVLPFTDKQISLLKTFADQAVIAIENVRLFKELEARNRDLTAALDRQTATSEILRVISGSRIDLQPVFDTILQSALRLCGALNGFIWRVKDGLRRQVSYAGVMSPEWKAIAQGTQGGLPTHESVSGWVQIEREVLHIPDLERDERFPRSQEMARAMGYRSLLAVPMLKDQDFVGAIVIHKAEPFDDGQIQLLRTFADQAVIAIENARLLGELQARTGELTRSVEELTALGDVSRALSSTLELETVLDTIVARASQLAGADGCSIYEYDEAAEVFRLRASSYADPRETETLDPIGRTTPIPRGQGVVSRAAALRQAVQIRDIAVEGAYESPILKPLLQAGYRAVLTVPLLLEEHVIGALGVSRKTPGEFAPEIVRLLTTFAIQSALAIQNARLFREIADKSAQLEAASRHKSEFLANMSHELRTPLNAIIGFSEVLAEGMFGEVNEKQTEYLRDILESGQHLLSLINDILDLSKIEAGRMELELTDFDLPQAISNALTLIRERAGRRGITLHQAVDKRLGQVRGDERKIKQVLLNLLSNALKFTPEGGQIDVRVSVVDGMAEVSVTDTGLGIAPEHQEVVFEEFRQVGTAAKKVEGTGLGLALSRKFIELHGGRIWVKSQVGLGSTFTFTIPVQRGE